MGKTDPKVTSTEVAETTEGVTMVSHKDTKQYAENVDTVESLKEVSAEPKKMTRAQHREALMDQMALASGSDAGSADTLLNNYIQFFGLNSAEDFVTMVQSVDVEKSSVTLKSGFVLPLDPAFVGSDLSEFITIMNTVLDVDGKSLAINLIKFDMENPDFDKRTKMAFYLLNQFIGFGRKTPNFDFANTQAVMHPVADILDYAQVYAFLEQVLEKPEELAGEFKGLVNDLVPYTCEAMGPLFSRDSLKKLGITFTSAAEGRDILYHNIMATNIAYLCYDLWAELPEYETADEQPVETGAVEVPKPTKKPEPVSKFVEEEVDTVDEEHEEIIDDLNNELDSVDDALPERDYDEEDAESMEDVPDEEYDDEDEIQ